MLDECFDPVICDKAYIPDGEKKRLVLGVLNIQNLVSTHVTAKIPSLVWCFGCKTSDVEKVEINEKLEINGRKYTIFNRFDDGFGMTMFSLVEHKDAKVSDYL